MLDSGDRLVYDRVVVKDEKKFRMGRGSGDRVASFETSKRWFAWLKTKDRLQEVSSPSTPFPLV